MKPFLIAILSIQLVVWGFVGIEILGFDIPIIRQIVCFLYLSFVPGILILRILRIQDLTNSETILYSVGLSTISVILVGLLTNLIFPLMGVYNPISLIPLVISLSILIFILSILCIISEFDATPDTKPATLYSDLSEILNFKVVFFGSLPILAIFGTYLMNYGNDNRLNLCLLILLSLLPIFVSRNTLPRSYYPFIILMASLSLLLDKSLITSYLCGSDIFGEYNTANSVLLGSQWLLDNPGVLNGMLSITILAPIYSIVTNVSLMWVLKIVYPLLFSLLPLGVYVYVSKQFNEKIAFLSGILVAYTSSFYGIMLEAARQQIAEIFLVLIIILIFQKIERKKKAFLLIAFSLGLIMSHYGISYIFLILLTTSAIFLAIDTKYNLLAKAGGINPLSLSLDLFDKSSCSKENYNSSVYLQYLLFFVVALISWYVYISSSVIFNNFVHLLDIIANSISLELDASSIEGLNTIVSRLSISREITKYVYLAIQSLISIGIFFALINTQTRKINKFYLYLSISFYLLLVASLVVPHSSASMTTSRVYHTSLILLAPYALLGLFGLTTLMHRFLSKQRLNRKFHKLPYAIASILFATLLIFDSGFVCEIIKDEPPNSYSLNSSVIRPSNFIDQEFIELVWFHGKRDESKTVLLDPYLSPLWGVTVGDPNIQKIDANQDNVPVGSYAVLGRMVVVRDKIIGVYFDENALVHVDEVSYKESIFSKKVSKNMDLIYNSGKTELLALLDRRTA